MPDTASQQQPDRWIGRVIDNRYRILEAIGRGGMGMVYKVVHTHMGKVAALKLLHANLAKDRDLIKRFHREATSISRLNHPNIVQVFDFGRADDSMYLVMEYLHGEDLALILRRDGPIPVQRCLPILVQICDALSEAHHKNIIHRDLKPENVRVIRTAEGQDFVKVMDFGLAKLLDEPEQDQTITERGSLMGTPYYMAPEMIRAKPTDHRIDLYSLGAVTYRMLTAQNAFAGKTPMAVLAKHISETVVPPSARAPDRLIPAELDAIVLKAMSKSPDQRYQTAAELKRDLIGLLRLLDAEMSWPGLTPLPGLALPGTGYAASRQQVFLLDSPKKPLPVLETMDTPVLSKEDLAFEQRLRRGRLAGWLIPVPVLALLGFLLYWFVLREGEVLAPSYEVEPNNTPEQAAQLLPGKRVSGQLGRRMSLQKSDRDWYRIAIKAQVPQALHARVTAIPNMDITLELFDATGGRITGADAAGRGGAEAIGQWVVDPGDYFLLVREVWQVGVPPNENVTDTYHLTANWERFEVDDWELEPNDTAFQASALKPGAAVKGYLSGPEDQDCFRLQHPPGKLSGTVSPLPGVDLALELTRKKSKRPVVVDKTGPSAGESFEETGVRGDPEVLVCVRGKAKGKPEPGRDAPGVDQPYTLSTMFTPAR